MTRITLIAAMARNRVIGRDGELPWHLPADLKHFKRTTLGSPVLMGRKTWDSIGRPLPGRRNLVLSRAEPSLPEGVELFSDVETALNACEAEDELFVIGGAEIYRLFLPVAHRLILTEVDEEVEGDTLFPPFDEESWHEVERIRHDADEKNRFAYSFVTWERVPSLT